MNLNRKSGISLFTIAALISVCLAGCKDTKTADTCFIYTDGLLDDLCAIEYLGSKYDHAVIMVEKPEEIAESQFASEKIKDENDLLGAAGEWFSDVISYSEVNDISEADLFLLAPLSGFAELLKEEPSLMSYMALLMAGDSDGPSGAGEEWNAIADIDAYRYVTENMKNLVQMNRFECENEYETNGYPFEAQYLDEYTKRMNSINENVCCYDLQAVAMQFK